MKEKVIVLRSLKWRESDLIIHTLNPRGGKMNFLARGALNSKKRFSGGVLEPTHYILADYRPGRSDNDQEPLHQLQEAELIKGFNGLREKYERLELALQMLAIVGKLAQPGVEDAPELFDLLGNGLYAAESSNDTAKLRLQFEAKVLYLQGVLPGQAGFAELLKRPLKEHAMIQLSKDEFRSAQNELKSTLDRYLQGLGPLSPESAEI